MEENLEPINSITFSHDSTKLATASDDKSIRIYDAKDDFKIIKILTGHTKSVLSIAFSHDN